MEKKELERRQRKSAVRWRSILTQISEGSCGGVCHACPAASGGAHSGGEFIYETVREMIARRTVIFIEGLYYHIYDRGTGTQDVFLSEDKYTFAMKKISFYSKNHWD